MEDRIDRTISKLLEEHLIREAEAAAKWSELIGKHQGNTGAIIVDKFLESQEWQGEPISLVNEVKRLEGGDR